LLLFLDKGGRMMQKVLPWLFTAQVVFFTIWDAYCLITGAPQETVTAAVRRATVDNRLLLFAAGVIAGHLFT
jgi:hypothetical protein